jgi:gamma-glutamyltranspeptidase/glutathione hydrolase
MVASGNPLVSALGLGVLRGGGNAVDAAVTMGFALAVAEPQHSQLGGDVFIQYWDASTRQVFTLNGAGEAPAGATIDGVMDTSSGPSSRVGIMRGLHSATIPGAVYGWLMALRRWGTKKPVDVVVPALSLAEKGIALSPAQVMHWRRNADVIKSHPHMAAAFTLDPLRIGAVLTQPHLAATLRQISEGGRAAFYAGPFADKLMKYSERKGGFFNAEDLKQHRSRIQDPLLTGYRSLTVTEHPLSSQGAILLEMLNILELHDLAQVRPESADAIHLMAEAKKIAFADRDGFLGDTGSAPVIQMLSKSYADRQRRRINQKAATSRFAPGKLPRSEGQELPAPYLSSTPHQMEGDATCVCVVDEQGNGVVMVQSLGHSFGSGVVVPETGVILNNRLSTFSLDPASPNALMPGKLPVNPLNTYMLFKGDDLWALGGTAGGDTQIETNVQVITHMVDHGRSPQEAIEAPRWYAAPEGSTLTFEERLPLDTCYDLRTLGHQFSIEGPWAAPCACQCIMIDPETRTLFGASDPRVDGLAVGF